MRFEKYVETTGLEKTVERVCQQYTSDDWNPVTKAAACHYYTSHEIPSSDHSTYTMPPLYNVRNMKETLQKGGNCCDKSVFLASLLTHIDGVETQFVQLNRRNDSGHLLLEVSFKDYTPAQVKDKLIDFYIENSPINNVVFTTEKRYGREWFLADSGIARHIGDPIYLRKDGFLEINKDGWEWTCKVKTGSVL